MHTSYSEAVQGTTFLRVAHFVVYEKQNVCFTENSEQLTWRNRMQRKIKSRRELMTAVVIYFSRAGENYLNGTKQRITKRNTAILAEKISHALAIESYELLPKIAYSESYDEAVQQAEKENKLLHGLIMRSCQLI